MKISLSALRKIVLSEAKRISTKQKLNEAVDDRGDYFNSEGNITILDESTIQDIENAYKEGFNDGFYNAAGESPSSHYIEDDWMSSDAKKVVDELRNLIA